MDITTQARGVHGLHCDATGSQGAETVSEARGSPPLGLRMARSDGRIHALGRFHISGVASLCMGVSAHRLYRHVESPAVADAVIEIVFCFYTYPNTFAWCSVSSILLSFCWCPLR